MTLLIVTQRININLKMICYFLFLSILILECHTLSSERYRMYDFATWCHPEGGKNTIQLKTSTAIFTLDEKNPVTANILNSRDISCHIELETHNTDYGFHVFFDEMNLDVLENSVLDTRKPTECKDFVQFGRDVFYFTTSKSRQFCGYRERLFYHNATQADYARASTQGGRLFIESTDHEMDLWLKVKQTKLRSRKTKRNLRLIVTVFKKGCSTNDMYWRKCDNTNYCVRKGHFCDNYANCGWPDGEIASDETHKLCAEAWKKSGEYAGHTGDIFEPTNIPTIIIVSLVVIISLFLLIFVIVRCVKRSREIRRKHNTIVASSNNRNSGNLSRRTNRRAQPEEYEASNSRGLSQVPVGQQGLNSREGNRASNIEDEMTPALLNHRDPGRVLPSAPPSYDEVIQVPYEPSAPVDDRTEPPPYSTTIS